MDLLRKFKNNASIIVFISNLSISIMNFSITIFLIRLLDQKEFGDYVVISNFVILLQVFIGVRTGEAILRYLQQDLTHNEKSIIINQFLFIDFTINIILYICILIFGYWYSLSIGLEYTYILMYGSVVIMNIGLSVFENLYIINNKIIKLYLVKLVSMINIFILTLFCGYIWQLEGVIIGFLFGTLIKNILHYFYIKDNIPYISLFKKRKKIVPLAELYHFFKHAYLSTTFKSGSQGLDIFMLSTVLGSEKIALYEAGKKFSQIPGLILGSIWASESNKILKMAQKGNNKELFTLINHKYILYIPLGILLSLLFYLFGKNLIIAIYGNEYIESFYISFIFFSSYWFGNLFGGFGRIYLIASNKLKVLTYLNSLLFINVLFLGYYFSRYNLFYMALTISLTLLFNSLYLNFYILKKGANKND